MRHDQLVPGPRHPDVEQPPLLLELVVPLRQRLVDERQWQPQRLPPTDGREPPAHEPGQVDAGELQALRLVDRHHRHGVRVGVDVRRGRVVPGQDQRLEVARQEDRAVISQERRLGADDVEEARDVGQRLLGGHRVRLRQPLEPPGALEERVDDLAGGALVRQLHVRLEVRDELCGSGPRLGRQAQDPRLSAELLQDLEHGPVAAARHLDDAHQVRPTQAVQLRRRQRVHIHGRRGIRDRPQERQEELDLGPGIQPAGPGEPPRDPLQVEGPQDRIRRGVGADEDGCVLGPCPLPDPPCDVLRDPVRLLRAARERLVPDRGHAFPAPLGHESLDDPCADLQAVGVVVADQPVGGLQDGRPGTVVPAQDHDPGAPVALPELQDVADRRATELVDRLIVVPHHRHVAMALGDEGDQLRLGPVGVLELVHQHVPEALLDGLPGRRRVAQQPQCERDLVPEVDGTVGGQQRLVAGVRPGELALPACLLLERRGGVPFHPGRRDAQGLHRRRRGRGLTGEARGIREVGLRRHVLVLGPREQRGQRVQEPGRVSQRAVLVQLELEQVLPQEDHGLRTRQHPHVRRQPELERELPDEAVPEGMERGDRGVRVAVGDQLVHPHLHLVGGLVREREGEDLGRLRPARGDQPRDAARDDLRLARARARDDQQRSVPVHDRAPLLRVEALEERVVASRGGFLRRWGLHGTPDGDLDQRRRFAADGAPPHAAGPFCRLGAGGGKGR